MDFAPRTLGAFEARADFHALDGLDGHHGSGQPRIKASVPLDMTAQAHRNAANCYLEDAAQCITCSLGCIYFRPHAFLSCPIIAVQLRACFPSQAGAVNCGLIHVFAADFQHLGDHRNAKDTQEFLAHCAHGNTHRRLPCRGTLQNIPHIRAGILKHAREICMPRTRRRHFFTLWLTKGSHTAPPVPVILIGY